MSGASRRGAVLPAFMERNAMWPLLRRPGSNAHRTGHLPFDACNDARVRWEGPSFEMPAATDAVERWRASTNVQKVSLFRLDVTRPNESSASGDRYIADYPIVPGSEVVLSESVVQALIDW